MPRDITSPTASAAAASAYTKLASAWAVEALNASAGGDGLPLSNPVQRAWRTSMRARHVSLNGEAVGTMYGQTPLLAPLVILASDANLRTET